MASESRLAAVVFDWAGTAIDFGCLARASAFAQLFSELGIGVDIGEARAPTGLPSWEHIRALGRSPGVSSVWRAVHGREFADSDADRLHTRFAFAVMSAARRHSTIVPGIPELVTYLREQGLKVGSTSCYSRVVMNMLAPLAAEQGFAPDNLVCADELPLRRTSPMAMYRCFLDLAVWPACNVVKVSDSVAGLMEGRYAGSWTVAVVASGFEMGLSLEQWTALPTLERSTRMTAVSERLAAANPDYTIASVADLPAVLDAIKQRLSRSGPS